VPAVVVEHDVACPARDGVLLRTDLYRPAGDGRWPTILMRTPYGKGNAQSNTGYAHPSWYARHGFLVAVQDCRGRWSSDGEFYPFLTEAEDGYDAVEWAAKLPGANGRVGLIGHSDEGRLAWYAAVSAPPHLAAIAPSAATGDPWRIVPY